MLHSNQTIDFDKLKEQYTTLKNTAVHTSNILAENESLKGINNYKLLFGGKLVTCVNYFSFNYWLLKRIVKILGLSGKM